MLNLFFILVIIISFHPKGIVDFGATWVIPRSYGPSCLDNKYVEVGFFTNFEFNNSQFQIHRLKDPNFSMAITNS